MKVISKKLSSDGFSHTEMLFGLIVVALVAFIGFKVIGIDHAQTPTLSVDNTAAKATLKNIAIMGPAQTASGTDNVQSSVPLYFLGYQTVSEIGPGQTLTYTQGLKGTNITSCYSFYVTQPKSGNISFPVEFTTNNNSVTMTVKSSLTLTDEMQQVCVPPGTGTNPGFNVEDQATSSDSPGSIQVLYDTLSS